MKPFVFSLATHALVLVIPVVHVLQPEVAEITIDFTQPAQFEVLEEREEPVRDRPTPPDEAIVEDEAEMSPTPAPDVVAPIIPAPAREIVVPVSEPSVEPVLSAPAAASPVAAPATVAGKPSPVDPPRPSSVIVPPSAEPVWIENAQYRRNPRPAYPARARVLGVEGTVILLVEINAAGIPTRVTIERSSNARILDDAARAAVGSWEFVPAKRNGEAVRSRTRVPVRFYLE